MENSFYYFFSATPQVLAAVLALIGVFVLFKIQSLNSQMLGTYIDKADISGLKGKIDTITRDSFLIWGVDPLLDTEAIRVTGLLKNWVPGKVNGRAVNVWYMIPVSFVLPESDK